MIAAFDSTLGGTIFDVIQASSDDLQTSEQKPFDDECRLRSSRDPVGYSKRAPYPKNHSQATRSAMEAEWNKSQTSEWMAYGVAASFRKFSFHRSPRKIVSSRADAITRLSAKMVDSTCVKYA